MTRLSHLLIAITSFLLYGQMALAQAELLPKGVGIYSLGYRLFDAQTFKYNSHGGTEPLGADFSKQLNGHNLLEGVAGDDLKNLATELKNFDGVSETSDGLLNSLDLGHIDAKINGQLNAKIFGAGYGLTDHASLFFGIPWTSAHVKSTISISGSNNAVEIKKRLGELAFDKLKAGLDKAANLSANDLKSMLTAYGYESPDEWKHDGIGDIQFGSIVGTSYRFSRLLNSIMALRTTISLPTGYYESPDNLIDTSLGKGYYALYNRYGHKFVLMQNYWIGGEVSYGIGLPTEVEKRVPMRNEDLIKEERKTKVTLNPGSDVDYGLIGGAGFVRGLLKSDYKLGVKRHFSDHYSGSIDGNYAELSKGSDLYQFYHEPAFKLDTTNLYKRGEFMIPFVIQISAHLPIQAKNSANEKYYQLSLSSFFGSPETKSNKKIAQRERPVQKKKRTYNRRPVSHDSFYLGSLEED